MIGTVDLNDVLAMDYVTSDGRVMVLNTLADARTHDQYPEVLESVRRYGVHTPILIRHDELCNGRHRVAACLELGIWDVPFTDDPAIGWANEFDWPEERESATTEKEAQNCE